MRSVVLAVISVLVGLMCGMMLARQLSLVRAYPRSLMVVVQHHLSAAKAELARGDQCDPSDVRMRVELIGRFSAELSEALTAPKSAPDPRLEELNEALAIRVHQVTAVPKISGCTALIAPFRDLEQACNDCHREYR